MAEFTRGQLKLAFSWHVAREILDADMEIAEGEEQWMAKAFPREALVDAGFVDNGGHPTAYYETCLGEALVTLPDVLSFDEKILLVRTLFAGTLADDEFHHEEGNVLVKAAHLLGLNSDDIEQALETIEDVGEVELDEALEDG